MPHFDLRGKQPQVISDDIDIELGHLEAALVPAADVKIQKEADRTLRDNGTAAEMLWSGESWLHDSGESRPGKEFGSLAIGQLAGQDFESAFDSDDLSPCLQRSTESRPGKEFDSLAIGQLVDQDLEFASDTDDSSQDIPEDGNRDPTPAHVAAAHTQGVPGEGMGAIGNREEILEVVVDIQGMGVDMIADSSNISRDAYTAQEISVSPIEIIAASQQPVLIPSGTTTDEEDAAVEDRIDLAEIAATEHESTVEEGDAMTGAQDCRVENAATNQERDASATRGGVPGAQATPVRSIAMGRESRAAAEEDAMPTDRLSYCEILKNFNRIPPPNVLVFAGAASIVTVAMWYRMLA